MRSTPKTKVQVAGGARYKALFDIMRSYLDVNLISHNGDRRPFLEICEDVKITIEEIIEHHHVFVIEATNHQLIFGQPFLLQMRVQLLYKKNDVKCTLHSKNGRRCAEFIICTDTAEKMKLADELFPESRIEAFRVVMSNALNVTKIKMLGQ